MITYLIACSIGLPWLGALLVWLIGDKHEKVQHWTAIFFSVVSAAAAVMMLWNTSSAAGLTITIGSVFGDFTFVADGLGVFLSVVATVIGSLSVVFSTSYMKGEAQIGRYYAFVLFFIGAMCGLVLTSNIMLMFLFWEITALCSYALIILVNAAKNKSPRAVSETGVREAPKKSSNARPTGTRPAGAKPAGARPAGAKPAGTKPSDLMIC